MTMDRPKPVDVDALRALEAAASPGPWELVSTDDDSMMGNSRQSFLNERPYPICKVWSYETDLSIWSHDIKVSGQKRRITSIDDALLIEVMRNALTGILDDLEATRRERDELRRALEDHHVYPPGSDRCSCCGRDRTASAALAPAPPTEPDNPTAWVDADGVSHPLWLSRPVAPLPATDPEG